MTLEKIIELCKNYAAARRRVAAVAADIRELQRKAIASRVQGLKNRAAEAAVAKDILADAIRDNTALFVKPRTRAIDGVKFGLQKGKSKLDCDTDLTVTLIQDHLPEKQAALVKIKKSLNMEAVKNLNEETRKLIRVSLIEGQDDVLINSPADDFDKLVDSLLEGYDDDEDGQQAK